MFFSLFFMIYTCVVATVYPFYLQRPFSPQIEREQAMMRSFLGNEIQGEIELRGERLYDALFVSSGLETIAYDFVETKNTDPFTKDALRNVTIVERATDNFFDYLLLLNYRFSLIVLYIGFVSCAAICVFIHGLILRHRRDYRFGDTPIFMNMIARTAVAWSVPLFFIVIMFPMALHPAIILIMFVLVSISLVTFALALPKRA